jgi:transposase-like protein
MIDIYIFKLTYYTFMGKRGPKPKAIDVGCPYETCTDHNIIGEGNVVKYGGYQLDGKRVQRYLCHSCGRAFCSRTNTAYYGLHTNEDKVDLALKMSIRGMSIEGIADVLEVQPVTVSNWLARAGKQCEKVNEAKVKNLDLPKVEMDEMWVIVQKK